MTTAMASVRYVEGRQHEAEVRSVCEVISRSPRTENKKEGPMQGPI